MSRQPLQHFRHFIYHVFVFVIRQQHSLIPNNKRHAKKHPQQQPSLVEVVFWRMVIDDGFGGV
jgi:hypothetical protein